MVTVIELRTGCFSDRNVLNYLEYEDSAVPYATNNTLYIMHTRTVGPISVSNGISRFHDPLSSLLVFFNIINYVYISVISGVLFKF
jgi:hypothetical protein